MNRLPKYLQDAINAVIEGEKKYILHLDIDCLYMEVQCSLKSAYHGGKITTGEFKYLWEEYTGLYFRDDYYGKLAEAFGETYCKEFNEIFERFKYGLRNYGKLRVWSNYEKDKSDLICPGDINCEDCIMLEQCSGMTNEEHKKINIIIDEHLRSAN